MNTISKTFAQCRAANVCIDLLEVTISPTGDITGKIQNPTRDLRATRPWGVSFHDTRQKELFQGYGPGTYIFKAVYA